MKIGWKRWTVIGLVVIISMATTGVAYADSGSVSTNCQSQSLCVFNWVKCNNSSTVANTTAAIINNGQTITFNITKGYPGYDPNISFGLINKNVTPGVVSSISYNNPNSTYLTMTLKGIMLNQIIGASAEADGVLDIALSNSAPQTMMGNTYSMSITIVVTQYTQPCQNKTNTCLTSIPNPSLFGQLVIFTANVTGAGGTPTGTIQFKVDGSNFGLPVNLIKGCANSTATTSVSVGNHVVTAVYSGDGNYATSTGNLTGGQAVNPALKSTATSVSSSKNPSDYKQSVTFTATINTISSAAGTPSGTVQFKIDGANFGSAVLVSNGTATSAAISTLSVGTHTVTAIYSGDANFATSTGTLSGGQKVHGITTITWPYKPSPCNWGQPCMFTCQLGWQRSGTPTGYVTFYDGSNSLGSCNISSNGSASISIGNLGVGSHNITAVYNGDNNNDGCSSNAVIQTINKVNSTTSLHSSAITAKSGTQVNFTATVAPGSATGTMTFKDGNTTLGTAALSGGQATFRATKLSVGTHSITAVYSGDANCNSCTSNTISQVITTK